MKDFLFKALNSLLGAAWGNEGERCPIDCGPKQLLARLQAIDRPLTDKLSKKRKCALEAFCGGYAPGDALGI